MNIFEVATRTKIRFNFKGLISLEDAWDLSVRDLDSIFKTLNAQLKQATEESLLDTKTKKDEELEIKIEIIKHIVKVKLEEENARLKAKEIKEQKQKLLELIALKDDESLKNMSKEELQLKLKELEG